MITTLLFILFAGIAIGCAVAMVAQRNPLYSAISLIGVLLSLACLYVMLAAPFIAAVQVIVYAGAIMVLRSEEHTSELQSLAYLVCRLLLEKKKKKKLKNTIMKNKYQ